MAARTLAGAAMLASCPAGSLLTRGNMIPALRFASRGVELGHGLAGTGVGGAAAGFSAFKITRDMSASARRRMQDPPKPPPAPHLIEKYGIRIEVNPSAYRMADLDVPAWKRWSCKASKFPWKYDMAEMCYLTEGRVRVYPDNADGEYLEFRAGDIAMFPKGMSCTWDCMESVEKYYFLCDSIEHHYGTSMEGKMPPIPPGRKTIAEILGEK